MFVRRYLLLFLILFQAAFVAESRAGDSFSAQYPYYNESESSSLFSPENWLPDRTGFNMPEHFREQGARKRSHTTNPWSLPVSRWAPAMPQYSGSAVKKNDYAQTPQYMKQAREQNTLPARFRSLGSHSYGRPNAQISSQSPYAESNWHQSSFQQSPRFVTPDVLDELNRQQILTQQALPLNAYKNALQKKQSCCQNRQHRMNSQNYARRTHQQANKKNYKQPYRYSNGLTMPFTMDEGQLNQERLLYMGDSLPTVPDAAISGLPPMNIFEPLPPVLSGSSDGIDWGTNRFGIGPYGDFLQQ